MAAILPFLAIASAAVGAVGSISSGVAASNAAKYNADAKEQQAKVQLDQASIRASNDAVKTRQKTAATRAGALQNGFELTGSISDILRTQETDGALEGLTAMYDGTTRANALRDGAALDRYQGDNALTAGFIGAGTSLLSGASKYYTRGKGLGE